MPHFGNHLRQLRQMRHLSLDKLASATGISRGYIWTLERKSDTNPSLDCLRKLARALGTTVGHLVLDTSASGVSNAPSSLLECQEAYALRPDDVADLARIRLHGHHPINVDDWYLLYLLLKRSVVG